MATQADFCGTWKLVKSDNFEEYMKGMGVGLAMRKAANLLSPTCKVTQNGDEFTIEMQIPFNTHVQKFKLGEPFEDMSPTGAKRNVIASFEDGKLVFKDEEDTDVPHTITREIVNGEMIMTCAIGDTVCKRIYKRSS